MMMKRRRKFPWQKYFCCVFIDSCVGAWGDLPKRLGILVEIYTGWPKK